jgi:hypothetical protein
MMNGLSGFDIEMTVQELKPAADERVFISFPSPCNALAPRPRAKKVYTGNKKPCERDERHESGEFHKETHINQL